MKKTALFLISLVVFVLPLCAYSYSRIVPGVPEYLDEYVGDTDVYQSLAVEYADAVIIEKTVRKNEKENQSISFDTAVLKDKIGKADWTGIDKGKGSRETVYASFEKDGIVTVVALVSPFRKIPMIRSERVVIDEIQSEKVMGKTVIIRYILPPEYMQSDNTGYKTPVPESVSFAAPDVLKFEYKDGAAEHWKIKPDAAYIKKNLDKFGSADRMLIWSNGEGKYAPIGDKNKAKSWNYNEDASKEPVYPGSPAPAEQ